MKVKMGSGLSYRNQLENDRKQCEAETTRKQLSAQRCKALGVSGPKDAILPLKWEIEKLRGEIDELRKEFDRFRKGFEQDRSQAAKLPTANRPATPRGMTHDLRAR